jgi:hypothetical protein
MSPTDAIRNLSQLIREAAAKHSDPAKIVDAVLKQVERQPVLLQMILDTVVREWLQDRVHREQSHLRRVCRKTAVQATRAGKAARKACATVAVAKQARQTILDTWMIAGRKLGDVTRRDLTVQAETHRNQAAGLQRNATFYDLIAKRMDEDQTVREALDEAAVQKLWAQVQQAA